MKSVRKNTIVYDDRYIRKFTADVERVVFYDFVDNIVSYDFKASSKIGSKVYHKDV